jgi:hypothetical protein
MNRPQPSDCSAEKITDQKKHSPLRTAGFILLGTAVIVPALLIYVGKQLISRGDRESSQKEAKATPPPQKRITLDTGERPAGTVSASRPQEEEGPAPAEEIIQEPVYVASDDSDRFHVPNCRWAGNINPENRIEFADRERALEKGYTPCGTCRP